MLLRVMSANAAVKKTRGQKRLESEPIDPYTDVDLSCLLLQFLLREGIRTQVVGCVSIWEKTVY